ncbi:MAG: hypothetical protein AAB637_02090 [Patescibacteria group bacterium]|mgnify:CR=1 FL=1
MKYKSPYEEQLQRIKRLRKNINQFADATDENFEDAIDAFTSFFIQCYHLRDWLIRSGYNQSQVDFCIQNNTWLSLCKNLANKQKHQKLKKNELENNFVKDNFFGVSTPMNRYYDYFIHKGPRFGINIWQFQMPVDVIEVADKCIAGWEEFLQNSSARVASF